MWFVAALFGWPAVALSLLCSTLGLVLREKGAVWAGAIIAGPFLFYLTLTPRFRYGAPVIAILYLAAGHAVAKRKLWLAWALWAPFPVFSLWLFSLVSSQG